MSEAKEKDIISRIRSHISLFWKENRQFFALLFCIIFFKSAVADLSSISGASMTPTLLDGDKVWVNKLAYDIKVPFTEFSLAQLADPKRGDIVIIDSKIGAKSIVNNIVITTAETLILYSLKSKFSLESNKGKSSPIDCSVITSNRIWNIIPVEIPKAIIFNSLSFLYSA